MSAGRGAALAALAAVLATGAGAAPEPAVASSTMRGVVVEGRLAFVLRASGVETYRLTGVATPEGAPAVALEPLGRLATASPVLGIDLDGDLLYAAIGTLGIVVVDRADPERLRPVGRLNTDGRIGDVHVRGDRALLAAGRDGLLVVDVSRPERPMPGSASPGRGDARRLAVEGDVLALAEDRGGVRLFDVSRPDVPRRLKAPADQPERARDVALRGDLLAVAGFDDGLWLYRRRGDDAPERIATIDPGVRAEALAWHGDLLLVGSGRAAVAVVDLADPAKARVRSNLDMHRRAESGRAAPFGSLALVPAGVAGLVTVDLTDPDAPAVVERPSRGLTISFPDETPTVEFDR